MGSITKNPYLLLVASAVIVVVILSLDIVNNDVIIDYELTSADYTSILTTLFFVALIAERFVDILIGASRRSGKTEIQIRLNSASGEDKKAIQLELDKYRAETEKQAMKISYVIGIFIALAGFRIFSALIDNPIADDVFFNTMDIILTGGIIAGGSKGINTITATMKSFFDNVNVKPKQSNPDPS